jgi:predicted O-methyltransferase YrrM
VAPDLRAVRERLLREGSVVSRLDGSVHRLAPVAIGAEEGAALAGYVREERARHTVEVGLGYAVSTLYVCEALLETGADARHVAIDPHQRTRFANCGLQVLAEAGVRALVELHEDESQLVLPRFLTEGRHFDLAFVDGDHRFDGVFLDLVYLGRLVRPGGIVFVDDYQLPAVARAVAFFLTNVGWTVEASSSTDPDHHWAAVRTAAEPVERAWDFFVDF